MNANSMRPLGILSAAMFVACRQATIPLPTPDISASMSGNDAIARGEYIVRNVGGCGGCHAGGQRQQDGPLSGGTEFKDWRLGTVRAANLTPDSATGLGSWNEAEIMRALRNGVRKDGRLLAPVMPYEFLHGMSDEDAYAVARYLKSQPPVSNAVRQNTNFFFGIGKLFFLGPVKGTTILGPQRAATAEYGGYLVNHVATCGHCHTPRGGLRDSYDKRKAFAGDNTPPKGFPAKPRNITPDSATGIGRWSEADFVRTLRTGVNPAGDSLHPMMPWRSYRRMTEDDLKAMYRYLRTVPAIRNAVSSDR
jgi:mono/diheme cytochrome c family protein